MSHGRERCPVHDEMLAERTNGNGYAYLECWCGYIEHVHRRVDPNPSRYSVKPNGKRRLLIDLLIGRGPYKLKQSAAIHPDRKAS